MPGIVPGPRFGFAPGKKEETKTDCTVWHKRNNPYL